MALTKIDDRGLKTPIDLKDNEELRFGTTPSMLLRHNGSNGFLENSTGNLILRPVTDEEGVVIRANNEVELYFDNGTTPKLETSASGISVAGDVTATGVIIGTNFQPTGYLKLEDSQTLYIGTGNDLQLYHDHDGAGGGNSQINSLTSDLYIQGDLLLFRDWTNGDKYCDMTEGGAVKLYHDGSTDPKFETIASGAKVTGQLDVIGESIHLYNSANTANTYIFAQNTGTGNAGFQMKNSQGEWIIIANDSLRFYDVDSTAERLTITSGGNVGIGTTSPSEQLHISSAATTNGLLVSSTDNNTRATIELNGKDSSGNEVELRLGGFGDTNRGEIFTVTNHDIGFATNNAAPQMILKTSGRLGIGTTSPSTALDVNGEISLPFNNTLRWLESDGTIASDIYTNSSNTLVFRNNSGTVTANLDTSGNLEIAGNLKVPNNGGIDFQNQTWTSATGANTTHEVLDHYEEGTWTPVFESYESGAWTTAGFSTAGTQTAYFTRIGRLVIASMWRTGFQTNTSDTAYTRIGGLPYAVYDSAGAGSVGYMNNAFANDEVRLFTGASGIEIYKNDGNWNSWADANNSNIYFTVQYIVQ